MRKVLLNGDELVCKSITYKETVNAGTDLRPGCVGSAMLTLECFGTQTEAVLAGDELEYYEDDTLIGVFRAEPSIKTRNSYTVVAYDNANKLSVDFSSWLQEHQADFPMTRAALVAAACTIAGVTNATPNWTGSTRQVQAFYADGLTCRDVLSYAAELSGFYVHCHADGKLYFHWYTATPNTRIYPSSESDESETRYAYKQDGLNYANYTVPAIDGVAVHPSGEDDVAYIYPASPAGDNLLHIRNNLLLTGATATVYNAAAQRIYTQMTAVGAYVPATAQMFISECPYESGETVLVTDIQGVSFKTIVMSKTVTASGVTLESTGNEAQDSGYENPQKALVQLASDVVQINKLKVGYAEIAQAVIDVLIANDITAQNLTIVDENGNVLATYDASGITLGQTDEAHAFFDFNSMELLTKDGAIYYFVGDMRNASGIATLTEVRYAPIVSGQVTVGYTIYSVDSVTVNGVATTNYSYTAGSNTIILNDATVNNDEIVVTYKTKQLALHYDIGTRASGSYTGANSVVLGANQIASANNSIVCGGVGNSATGNGCAILGGYNNTAGKRMYAIVVGGYGNTASGYCSAIISGYNNTVSENHSVIAGGGGNSITKQHCFVTGADNSASAHFSAVFGQGNTATGQQQFVFGRYNATDSAKAEVVGNGTATTPSNARTLDWDGNEWLAGEIDAASGSFRGQITTPSYLRKQLPVLVDGTTYFGLRFFNADDTAVGAVGYLRNGTAQSIRLVGGNVVNGSVLVNRLDLGVDDSGNAVVTLSNQDAWRTALGMGSVLDTAVDMTPYTSTSSLYTAPSDGYLEVFNNSGQTAYGCVYGSSSTSTSRLTTIGGAQGRFSVFVQKGMRVCVVGAANRKRFTPISAS